MHDFRGAHRRNELTSVTDGVKVYTDYGHNPAEIRSALDIAAMEPHKTLWAVWQPHTYSRTKTLFDQFLTTFDKADKVLVTDICAAREKGPGDSIYYDSSIPHAMYAVETDCRFIAVVIK